MTLVIAHRGFSGKYPENTLLSFRKAMELGVDWIETDVHLSLDHRLILMHDKKINRTCTGKGFIRWKNLKELRKNHIKKGNHEIPVAEDLLPLLKKKIKFNLELKSAWAAKPLADFIKKYKLEKKIIVSSYSIVALKTIKREIPSLKTAYPFFISSEPRFAFLVNFISKISFQFTQFVVLTLAISSEADYIHLSYPLATPLFIKRLHKRGFKVNIWVVNTKALMKKLIKRNVDGIFTDYPDKLKRVIKETNNNSKKKRNFFDLRSKKK